MVVKLANVIFILSKELLDVILILSIEALVDIFLILLLKKSYAGDRAGKYYIHSINGSADKYYLYTTIKSHY